MLRSLVRIGIATAVGAVLLLVAATLIVRQPLLITPNAPPPRASADRIARDVRFLTNDVRPRDARHPANLDAAASYIATQLRTAGARVRDQRFTARRQAYRNVIADFGPADPRLPVYVIGAHYDEFSENGALPGADDNASGAAALLELARILAANPPALPIELVAFTNEEPPFFGSDDMGSAVHAESLQHDRRRVAGMVCLEMIGYYTPKQRWDAWLLALMYPSRGDFLSVAGGWSDRELARDVKRAMSGNAALPIVSFSASRPLLDASDQRNYWMRGMQAVMVGDTAYERNPNYHTARDTAETLDYARIAYAVDGLARFCATR